MGGRGGAGGGGDVRYPVVIVDDASEVRDVLSLQLSLSGRFDVVGEGASGRDAVELARRHYPALLLLDASMPDMDGLDALPAVLAASPATRVVMLSGFDAATLAPKALELGAADYIEKSAPINELPRRLLAVLEDDMGTAEGDVAGARPAKPADSGTAERAPEAVLAEHLERFRTVFDQAAIGMATLTLTGTIVRANEALARLAGEPEPALVGRRYSDLASPDDREAVALTVSRAAHAAGEPGHIEHRVVAADEDRWAKSTLATVNDTDGRPLYLFAQTEDITRRHQVIEELRQSEERFRLMVESVQDYAIFMLDPGGHVATWNLGAERLKGYRADEIVGRHFRTFYPADVAASGHPEHELIVATRDGRYEEEGWRVRKDGTRFWANVVITALFGTDGNLVGFAKVTRDMTERRRAQQALKASEERFRLMVESVQDYAIFMLDPGGYVATWNLGAERLKGYRADEIVGRHFRTFYPADVAASGHPEHELIVATRDGRYEEEGWRVRKDGTRFWANVVITALFGTDGNLVGFAKVTRDMTERRRAQDERDRAAADLAASNRQLVTAARQTEEFLAVTAHELQSPVTAITGAIDILLGYWDRLDDQGRREALERIASGSSRIRRLLDDLLTASRLEAGSFDVSLAPVDVADAVAQALGEVRPVVAALEDVTVHGAEGVTVLADRGRLVQILTNLLSNAAKYGQPPVVIDVRTPGRGAAGDLVDIAVRDGGHGVAEDVASKLFEKFARGAQSTPRGTGLGLFIVRELARLQGGDARYERNPDGRTSFVVSFARALPAASGSIPHP